VRRRTYYTAAPVTRVRTTAEEIAGLSMNP
jgi:hypothetical protein